VKRTYSTIKQALIAFSFDFSGIFAGWIASKTIPVLSIAPWILVIYPMVLTIRGNIAGIFTGNLSTLLNIGLVKPRFTKNTKIFYSLLSSIFFLALITGLLTGLITFVFSLLFF